MMIQLHITLPKKALFPDSLNDGYTQHLAMDIEKIDP